MHWWIKKYAISEICIGPLGKRCFPFEVSLLNPQVLDFSRLVELLIRGVPLIGRLRRRVPVVEGAVVVLEGISDFLEFVLLNSCSVEVGNIASF